MIWLYVVMLLKRCYDMGVEWWRIFKYVRFEKMDGFIFWGKVVVWEGVCGFSLLYEMFDLDV